MLPIPVPLSALVGTLSIEAINRLAQGRRPSTVRCIIVIPSRFASTRLPGKPLLKETGKYLVQQVYEQALLSKRANHVVVATDDDRIEAACISFGAPVERTDIGHPSGTDRVAEVAQRTSGDLFLNLQGDEPLINPDSLDMLFDLLIEHPDAPMATLATPLASLEEYSNPAVVKVVRDQNQRALYFSRSPIPHVRDGSPDIIGDKNLFLRHLGLYCYRKDFLLGLAKLPVHPLERVEKLEQLRVIGMGYPLLVGLTNEPGVGVDTPADYEAFVARMALKKNS